MPHEMTSPSSTLKQTRLQQTTTCKKKLPELSSNFTLKTSNSYILKIIGPGHFHSEYLQIETATRNLPHNRPVYRVIQVTPSFTGSLGSSHITTSASTSLEASFPQFELRMTSQKTTAVERQQKFLGRENHMERKSSGKFSPQFPFLNHFSSFDSCFLSLLLQMFRMQP